MKIGIAGYGFVGMAHKRIFKEHEIIVSDPDKQQYGNLKHADCIIICAAHKNIKNLSINYLASNSKKGALILDGRRYFERNEINKIKKKGLKYIGIGR